MIKINIFIRRTIFAENTKLSEEEICVPFSSIIVESKVSAQNLDDVILYKLFETKN